MGDVVFFGQQTVVLDGFSVFSCFPIDFHTGTRKCAAIWWNNLCSYRE